ncbi:hypothetical protein ABZ260_28820 [Streptosporangium sp. NPDC006013]|uniref:hypothetical protein n=1 Tax=Streptosporangium sp. NPDC006013 TaxID=3155596 RepID=UPI0033BE7B00
MLTVRQLLDYLTGLPDETLVVIDVHDGDSWHLRVEEVSVTTAQDVTEGGDPHEGTEVEIFWEPGQHGWTMNGPSKTLFTLDDVEKLIAERDAFRRELGELRSGLCFSLGKHRRAAGPQELTVMSVLSDQEILGEIERLRTVAAESATEPNPEL